MNSPYPYIPRYSVGGGDPWSAAANSYQRDLDVGVGLQRQGMMDASNGPGNLFQAFMSSYTQAKQQAMQEQEMKRRQQLADLQAEKEDRLDTQAKLKATADLQGAIAKGYRPELRQFYAAQLKAVNPEWSDKQIEAALPTRSVEAIPDVKFDPGGESLPLYPSDPKLGQGYRTVDNFKGLDVKKEEDDIAFKKLNLEAKLNDNQRHDRENALLQMLLLDRRGQQGLQQLQVKIDAGAYNKLGQTGVDLNDPNNHITAREYAIAHIRDGAPIPSWVNRDSNMKNLISSKIGELIASGELKGGELARAQAAYRANAGSLASMQKMTDSLTAFEKTARGNWVQFEQAISDLGNTGTPVMNTPINKIGKDWLGNPKISAAVAAGQSALTEYARILNNPNLVGELPVTTRQEIFAVLPGGKVENATLAQVQAVGRIFDADAQRRKANNEQQIADIKGRMGGSAAPQGPAKSPAEQLVDKAKNVNYRNKKTGREYSFPIGSAPAARAAKDPDMEKI